MKKIYLFVKGAKRWNSLLNKFSKLHKRLQLLLNSDNETQYNKLVKKLQSIYSKLEKMQYQTGIKIATTSLAIILTAFTANAQFAAKKILKYDGEINTPGRSSSTFADIDGDGDQDLYVGNSKGRIDVFTNNNGEFTSTGEMLANGVVFSLGTFASPVFADIDGDSDLDLFVGNGWGKIVNFINTNGTFSSGANLQAAGVEIDLGYNSSPEFADIDGDGDLDIYAGNALGEIHIYTNNAGAFTSAGILGITGPNTIASYVGSNAIPAFTDGDGDGDLDLYIGNMDGEIAEFTNNGGVFTYVNPIQANGATIDIGQYASPAFADIDGDSDLDLIVNGQNSKIKIYTNTSGVFSTNSNIEADDITIDIGSNSAPTFADIDGDGDQDLYVGGITGNDNEIKIYTNNGGVFNDINTLQITGLGSSPKPTFEDLDGDGDLDLYVGEYYGAIKSWTNNNGNFTSAADLQADGSPINMPYNSHPSFADIDSDGDLDLYVGHYGVIDVFTNNSGVFTAGGILQTNGVNIDVSYYAAPTFADIDADGDLDLYVGKDNGRIQLFTNTNGVFGAGVNLQAGGGDVFLGFRSSPTFVDIDNDGDLDLYAGNSYGNIFFYENTDTSAILVSSITIQSAGSVNTITTQGGTLQMSATVLPANASNSNYTWSVTNGTGSATIDANGLLSATGNGTVTVTATANDASGETATFVVTLSNQIAQAILVNSITIQGAGNASTITTQGGTLQMSATVLPANADDATYTWSVTNGTGSATIDANGLLTATGDGTVTVTATANDGSGETATYVVTISNQIAQAVLVGNINVLGQSGDSTITTQGGSLQMQADVLPMNADDATYTWSVVNGTGSATISNTGLLTASADGTVEVIATANDASGVSGTKTITISNQSVGINELAFQNLSVYPNPTSNFINLNVSEELSSIRIMDMTGKTVKVFNSETRKLDISEFTSGIYFLEIANTESKSIVKIIRK